MVELVAIEVEAADQGADGTINRAGGDESGFDLGQLHDLPVALVVLLHMDDGAAAQALVGGCLVIQHALGEFEPIP